MTSTLADIGPTYDERVRTIAAQVRDEMLAYGDRQVGLPEVMTQVYDATVGHPEWVRVQLCADVLRIVSPPAPPKMNRAQRRAREKNK